MKAETSTLTLRLANFVRQAAAIRPASSIDDLEPSERERAEAEAAAILVMASALPVSGEIERKESDKAFSDWAFYTREIPEPIGYMQPQDAARHAFYAGAKWAALRSHPQTPASGEVDLTKHPGARRWPLPWRVQYSGGGSCKIVDAQGTAVLYNLEQDLANLIAALSPSQPASGEIVDMLRNQAFDMSCELQFSLATQLAANIGYELKPDRPIEPVPSREEKLREACANIAAAVAEHYEDCRRGDHVAHERFRAAGNAAREIETKIRGIETSARKSECHTPLEVGQIMVPAKFIEFGSNSEGDYALFWVGADQLAYTIKELVARGINVRALGWKGKC